MVIETYLAYNLADIIVWHSVHEHCYSLHVFESLVTRCKSQACSLVTETRKSITLGGIICWPATDESIVCMLLHLAIYYLQYPYSLSLICLHCPGDPQRLG